METQPQNTEQTYTIDDFISEATPESIRRRYRSLAAKAKEADFGELDEDVVILDTETTGVSFKSDQLIQIAAARMVHGEITEWYVTFVDPGMPIPEDIQHLTHITNEDVAGAPTAAEALAGLVEFVGSSDIVAHNAQFDQHFTTKDAEGRPLRQNIWIDSLDLARIALPRLTSHRLLDLVRAFGGPLSTHRADDDVRSTCMVYRVLLAGVDAMDTSMVAAIAGLATTDEWPTVRVFKHFAKGANTPFDLRKLRAEKIKLLEGRPKVDADALLRSGERDLRFPSVETIDEAFGPDGVLAEVYENYEARDEQLQMSRAVNKAFTTSTNLAVEAGTGVGKSMAYLVPAVLTAKANGITVGVATKTNNLLDQLVNKELPLLDSVVEGGVSYAPLKGASHYLCLRKLDRVLRSGAKMVELKNGRLVSQAASIAALLSYVEQTDYDDLDALRWDFGALPRWEVTSTSQECLGRKCPFFGSKCFMRGARQRAEQVDVLVTNHSLLFCDLALDGGLLPPIRYWVVDEAHSAEAGGREAFSVGVSAEKLLHVARRVSSDEASRNVFLRAERRLGNRSIDEVLQETTAAAQNAAAAAANAAGAGTGSLSGAAGSVGGVGGIGTATTRQEGTALLFALTGKARSAGKAFAQAADEFCTHIKDLLVFEQSKRSKGYERIELWINDEIRASDVFATLTSFANILSAETEKLIKAATDLVAILEELPGAAEIQTEISALTFELRETYNALDTIFFAPSTAYVYSAALNRKVDRRVDSLLAQPLNIGDMLDQTLYANTHSVVFTSATITTDRSFDAFTAAVGLGRDEASAATFLQMDSSYDFDRNMTIYVVEDMPEPNELAYLAKLQDLLVRVHRAQGGSTLTLFTNKREMETCYDAVLPQLRDDDLRVLCQRWNLSIKNLRDEFLQNESLSLFATKSFWEGFDAPGSTLKTVVIPKLPFKKPSDPLSRERELNDPRAWAHFVLPEAIIETRQAAGRLIRSATDTGSLVLADKRLLTKGYGKKVLNSMPSRTIKVLPMAEIARELAEKRER